MKVHFYLFRRSFNLLITIGFMSCAFKNARAHTGNLNSSQYLDWNTTINFNALGAELKGLGFATSGITFNQVSPNTISQMAVLSASDYFVITTGPDPQGTDRGVLFNIDNSGSTAGPNTGSVDYRFKSTDGTEFKLSSMQADMGGFDSEAGYRFTVTITGYRNGAPVASDNINFSSTDATGSVSYTKNPISLANGGVLTFDTDWENIDEVRFTGGDNSTIRLLMLDDIALLPAVPEPMPVTLVKFTGTDRNDQPTLSWTTSLEKNFSHFEIEKSAESLAFFTIGSVDPNSKGIYQYLPVQYEDQAYYRLKMVDLDGSFEYSKIVSIYLKDQSPSAIIYPNPAQASIFMESLIATTFEAYDIRGHKVMEAAVKPGENKIEIGNLAKGVYHGLSNGQRLKFVKH